MHGEFFIREASVEDTVTICELWAEMIDFHAARDRSFERSSDGKENFRIYILNCLEEKDAKVLVAESDGEIAAYCLALVSQNPPVFNRKEFGLISDLAVKEQWRNKGLGRAIFYQIEAWFKSRGINRMELEVATTNEISQRFWQSLGFNPCRKKLYKEY